MEIKIADRTNRHTEFVANTSRVGSARYAESVIIAIVMTARAGPGIALERLVQGLHLTDSLIVYMTDTNRRNRYGAESG